MGEVETAAWELASGGCGPYLFYWVDRALFLLVGPLIAPRKVFSAWRRGWGQRNLYRIPPKKLLAMDLCEVRDYVTR